MLVKLELNQEKISKYNEYADELNKKYSDLGFRKVEELSDIFTPYHIYKKALNDSGYKEYTESDIPVNISERMYVCGLNDNHTLELITDYKEVRYNANSQIYWHGYGVADNASQVAEYYNKLCEKYGYYMNERDFVILMVPIFRDVNAGWRWHKWGRYIGNFQIEHEYLWYEEGIDLVYCFHIYEVERLEE